MRRRALPLLLVTAALPLAFSVGCGAQDEPVPDPALIEPGAGTPVGTALVEPASAEPAPDEKAAAATPKKASIPATPLIPMPVPTAEDSEPTGDAGDASTPPTPPTLAEESAARLKELNQRYSKERSEYYKAAAAQRELLANDPEAAVETLVKAEPAHIERLLAAAADYEGTEHAVKFLLGAFGNAARLDAAQANGVLATILDGHIDSPSLSSLTFTLIYNGRTLGDDVVQQTIDRVVEHSPHDAVKAGMLYARGSIVNRNRSATAEQREGVLATLAQAAELAPESRYGELARSTIFELTKLQVGLPAPDIEGNDLDGVAFKLSDYKGKVVLLDFWGDW